MQTGEVIYHSFYQYPFSVSEFSTEYYEKLDCHISLGTLNPWQILRIPLFLMNLNLLKRADQVLGRMHLSFPLCIFSLSDKDTDF